MRDFARLPVSDHRAFFTEAAARRGVRPWLVEKDFWVCWLHREIFALPALRPHLVFKGGTSLSKVFNIIDRFSEDIDLSLSPAFLGIAEYTLEDAASRTQRDKNQKQLEARCADIVCKKSPR
jgi:predicted nucleotidyltransferase component of viral defense system